MTKFQLKVDVRPFQQLDQLALLSVQEYNNGDTGNWFLCFRKGMSGFHSRLYGVHLHYKEVHAWRPQPRCVREPEYHLSSIFFNMDSALECLVYATNALGYSTAPDIFMDITSEKAMRTLGPWAILGGSRKPLSGFEKLFPRLSDHWGENRMLIDEITRQHDVSKHRSTIYVGGKARSDAPPGFFESLGIEADSPRRWDFAPMEEIILDPDPKKPPASPKKNIAYEDLRTLEGLAAEFSIFTSKTSSFALEDACSFVKLRHATFLERYSVVCVPEVPLYEDAACSVLRRDVCGLIIGHGHRGYSVTSRTIVPITRRIKYEAGAELEQNPLHDYSRVWSTTWYVDPSDGQPKQAWGSACEYLGQMCAGK